MTLIIESHTLDEHHPHSKVRGASRANIENVHIHSAQDRAVASANRVGGMTQSKSSRTTLGSYPHLPTMRVGSITGQPHSVRHGQFYHHPDGRYPADGNPRVPNPPNTNATTMSGTVRDGPFGGRQKVHPRDQPHGVPNMHGGVGYVGRGY
jgi:hypothetical protein